jgi:pilus assembly protein CpaE
VSEASAIGAEIANKVLVVTTPDVLALRGVRRLRELWSRLQVRADDEEVYVVLNRASRRREIQPDLARKVVGGRMAETVLPADFDAFEAAVNTGTPARLEEGKLRGAIESLVRELDVMPAADDANGLQSRGLLGRLTGERGQAAVDFAGVLPIFLLVVITLWQVGLMGYSYVVAGHAAREGARQLAVDPTDGPKEFPYRDVAREELPGAWRKGAQIKKEGAVSVRVNVNVPLFIPGVKTPWRVGSTATTSVEDEGLPPTQAWTPTPTPRPKG